MCPGVPPERELPEAKRCTQGVANVFPKNATVHRGLARGPNPNFGPRVTVYLTLLRKNRFQVDAKNPLETAEFAPGFVDGFFTPGGWT